MYCRVLACDFDGTTAVNGQLAPEVAAAIGRARSRGIAVLLATGRVLEEVQTLCSDLSMFDAVVAENGALIWFPDSAHTVQIGQPPPEKFLGELRARGAPFHVGAVIVGTWDSHTSVLLELIRRFALDCQMVFNRGAVMLLPSGINKATGVRRALEEIGRCERNLVAFGDAENDLALFSLAEVAVAAGGSLPAVAAQADEQLSRCGGAAVAKYINRLLDRGGYLETPKRRHIVLGTDTNGIAAILPCAGVNATITGDPRSGKSWLAGLVAEKLIEQGYRLCIIDPEGDYAALAQRPGVLLLGGDLSLPEAAAVPRVLRDEPVSLILSLARLSQRAQIDYVGAVLAELEKLSAATGIPQWILIDEAHYFFPKGTRCPQFTGASNFLFSTYRPSLLADSVYAAACTHLVMRTAVEEERYFMTGLLGECGPKDLSVSQALADLDTRVGLLVRDAAAPRWQVFKPAARRTGHTHHARKYADTQLPEQQAFRFLNSGGASPTAAHNVTEFHRAVGAVTVSCLRHHLSNADFSRWAADVLGDQDLARGLHKLERAVALGAKTDRQEILSHIESRYLIEPERTAEPEGARHQDGSAARLAEGLR